MRVIKRNGDLEDFNIKKIVTAIEKAYNANDMNLSSREKKIISKKVTKHFLFANWINRTIPIETIQDYVEKFLLDNAPYKVARSYIVYRETHKFSRFVKDRINYMIGYTNSDDNAATASEVDANANVTVKNVANLEGEVYKSFNKIIQRQRMKDKLNELYPEVADQYAQDLKNGIIYCHDESSSPALKFYCLAATLYPLMLEGTGNIDGVTPSPPNDIQSFSGQVTNLVFLLSSQAKGACALGDYFIALNLYVIKEFGENWYEKLDKVTTTKTYISQRTIKDAIRKGMKQFIYGVNQPAGNRSYNSPFTNVSFYDRYYFESLFKEFYYPDGTQPKWEAIDQLQRIFMELHRELRLVKPLTFPVTTMALLHDGKDFKDQEYKNLCAEEWAKGGSFFLYTNDNASSLASCCRVLNEVSDNTFSSTTGMTGIMTGSCNVITLNINRIVQDYYKINAGCFDMLKLKEYLITILERVYKYQIAYKTMLYDMEDKGMYSSSNAGYIYLKKLYSTIGLIGYYEAAKFLGYNVENSKGDVTDYVNFLGEILGTVKEQNKLHSIHDKKRPHLFNSEAVPGENLGVKFYEKDKADGYWVPEDQNLYNCYFYNPWGEEIIFDKMRLHGRNVSTFCDGGQAAHLNLQEHLTKEQYLTIMQFAIREGVNYFTFNIPFSECKDCHHVVHAPIKECPKCHSTNIDWWTRIIGYLRPISAFSKPRQIEADKRYYNTDGRYIVSPPKLAKDL